MITHLDTMTISNGSKNLCLFTTSGLISSATSAQRFVARALMASILGTGPHLCPHQSWSRNGRAQGHWGHLLISEEWVWPRVEI